MWIFVCRLSCKSSSCRLSKREKAVNDSVMKIIFGLFLEMIWDPAPLRNFPFGFQNIGWCIPYRVVRNNDEDSFDLESSLEVLMISSPNRDDLVFPKGGWEDDETVEEAACREALEEAGVKGIIKGDSLGDWTFRSKSRQESGCLEGGCKVCMFAMEVTEELDAWPEQENHDRKWLFIKDAFQLCRYKWMSTALEKFLEVMATENKHGASQSLVVLRPAQVSDVSNSLVVLNPAPVSEVVTENPIMSTNCLPSLLSQNSTVLESFKCPAQQC